MSLSHKNIMNRYLKGNKFLREAKTTLERPLYYNKDRNKIQNYRMASQTFMITIC